MRSLLRIKSLYDRARQELPNRTLEQRVRRAGRRSCERLARLKRFFSPQLAELIVAGGAEDPLKSHRREITVVFLDLRGFTAFAETAEPEEVMGVLREYHARDGAPHPGARRHARALRGRRHDGVLQRPGAGARPGGARGAHGAGDAASAARRSPAQWQKRGYELDFGIGIAQGYATIGAIGFEGRLDYGAIGTVTNLAARLCGEAQPGQILISKRVLASVDELVRGRAGRRAVAQGFRKAGAGVQCHRA